MANAWEKDLLDDEGKRKQEAESLGGPYASIDKENVQKYMDQPAWQKDLLNVTDNKGGSAVERFNKGLLDLILSPADLVNAGIKFAATAATPEEYEPALEGNIPQIPTDRTRSYIYNKTGNIPDPNVPAEGAIAHAAEILGGSVLPAGLLMGRGNQILSRSIRELERLGVLDNMAVVSAARPTATIVGETMASTGAGVAREASIQNEASAPIQMLAELFGAFAPGALIGVAGKVSMLRVLSSSVAKHIAPFTKAGAWPRAANRLQEIAANPKLAASRVKDDSLLTPARQTEDEGLLGLEKKVMQEDPAFREEVDDVLEIAKEDLKDQVLMFGGEPSRARQLLVKGKQYLIDLLDMRAAQAGREAEEALSRLDPNATPRQVSQTVRRVVDDAYEDALNTERSLWNSIDSNAEINITGTRQTMDEILALRSQYDNPEDIPEWIVKALKPKDMNPAIRDQLQRLGMIDQDGNILPQARKTLEEQGLISETKYTFNDIKAIRSRALAEVRAERGKEAPNRNKIRILNKIANGDDTSAGLIDDLSESGIEGVDSARDYSRHLNERFRTGKVGRLLSFDSRGTQAVTPKETLDVLLAGKDPATTVEQLVTAAPVTKPLVEDYLKADFLDKTFSGGSLDKRAAKRWMDQWRRKGIFEVYPELESQLSEATSLTFTAERLGVRADRYRTWSHQSGKSRAALYLNNDPGEEMSAALNSKRPAATLRSVVARVDGDPQAVNGLKTSFLEEGFKRSRSGSFHDDGSPIYSGKKFSDFLENYETSARALGVTDAEWQRLESIAQKMRNVEMTGGAAPGRLLDDKPAAILDLAARWLGARAGGQTGNSIGSSLVLAGAFSERMRNTLTRITRDHAEKLLIAAHKDPKLYRALLTRPDMPPARQDKAATILEAWMVGAGITQAEEMITPESE